MQDFISSHLHPIYTHQHHGTSQTVPIHRLCDCHSDPAEEEQNRKGARNIQVGSVMAAYRSQRCFRGSSVGLVLGDQTDNSIAQALAAASQTIKAPLGLHSQHCYFLLPADASIPINYEVERLRDGKSYANRLVKAIQRDKPVFILAASYTLPPIELPKSPKVPDAGAKEALSHSLRFALGNASESGAARKQKQKETDDIQSPFGFSPKFQIEFPEDVMGYEECEQEESRWTKFLSDKAELDGRGKRAIGEYIRVSDPNWPGTLLTWQERLESPVAIAVAKLQASRDEVIAAGGNKRMLWMKARLQPDEKPDIETIKVGLPLSHVPDTDK